MSVLAPITKRYVSYVLEKQTQNSFGTGKSGRRGNSLANENIDLCVIPMDIRTIEADTDGNFKLQDLKIYREGDTSQLPHDSILNYKSKKYRIRALSNREDNGGFSIWHGKLITQ